MLFIVPDDAPPQKPSPDDSGELLAADDSLDFTDTMPDTGKVELDLDDAPFLIDDEPEEPEPEPEPKPPADLDAPPAQAEAPGPAKGGRKNLLRDKRVWAGAGSALALLAVAAFFLFRSPEETPPSPPVQPPPVAQVEEPPKEPEKPAEYYIRWEPFWVEFTDADGNVRFLICRFAGITLNPALKAEAESKEVMLRDTIYYYLIHKDKEFLSSTANAEVLKRDVLAVVNQYLSSGQLDQILLEDYVIK